MQLLRAVIERAFGELELEQLFVRVPDDQGPTLSGYRRAGFRKLGHLPGTPIVPSRRPISWMALRRRA